MERIVSGWTIEQPFGYVFLVFFFALLVRAIVCWLRALELKYWVPEEDNDTRRSDLRSQGLLSLFLVCFCGFGTNGNRVYADMWFPFLIGLFELAAFPVLLTIGAWQAIAAWLGFKAIAPWQYWQTNRHAFNRFLIGNAIILLFSALFLAPLVDR